MSNLPNVKRMSELKQVDCPLTHNFSDGVYARTIFMPKGTFVIGKKHLTEHFNMIMSGSAKLWIDGKMQIVQGPDIINSKKGCRKILLILEDMYWTTIHKTNETDINKIEEMIIQDEPMDKIEIEIAIKELKCLTLI